MTNVNSADKKPEKYVKPNGKVGIRMIPVDKEVVKNEAYDEPQGQAKRMMSPLQKARMDKEKADRDRDGKLKPGVVKRGKSTMNRLKDIRQRADAFAAKSRKEEVEQVDEGNMMSAAKELETYARKFGGIDKGDFIKASIMMKKNQRKQLDKFVDELDTEPREKIQSVMRKHIKENISEVLDRPGALDSYRKKADDSGNKARNSATRKILTAPKDGKRPDHSDELKTMRKRNKGQDMADRVAARQFRKSIGQPYIKKEEVEQIDEISQDKLRQYHGKAGADLQAKRDKVAKGELSMADLKKGQNRVKGLNRSANKMEEVEQLDELSPRTKASYLKKASAQNKKVQKAYDKSVKSSPDAYFGDDSPEDQKRAKTMDKRQKGMAMAKGRKYGQKYESVEEKKALTMKQMRRALQSIKPSKKKPTLPKAPWDKKDD